MLGNCSASSFRPQGFVDFLSLPCTTLDHLNALSHSSFQLPDRGFGLLRHLLVVVRGVRQSLGLPDHRANGHHLCQLILGQQQVRAEIDLSGVAEPALSGSFGFCDPLHRRLHLNQRLDTVLAEALNPLALPLLPLLNPLLPLLNPLLLLRNPLPFGFSLPVPRIAVAFTPARVAANTPTGSNHHPSP
ncbi:MAG TPA: hypothetical protein VF328_26640 [Mycobacterium sp.]